VKLRDGLGVFASIEAMGGKITSFSGNNSFGLSLDLLSSDVEKGLEVVGDILINPRFSRKRIEREKEKMFAKLKREEDNIFSYGFRLLKRNLFKRHPYRFHYLGTKESLTKITTDDVINFYNKFVVPANTVLSIFGDIDRENVLAKVESIFAQMEQREFKGIDSVKEPIIKRVIEFSEPILKEQTLVILGFLGTNMYNEDRYSLELISSILSGAGGRLYKRIRDELGLAYTLGAFSVTGIDYGYYCLYVATDYDNLGKVKKELLNEIKRLKEKIVNDDELRVAKQGLIGENMISLQGNSSLAFRASLDELYGLGFDNYAQYSKRINKITAEEIKKVANKYFNLNAYCVVTLTQGKTKQ
jgi:zinc protease